VAHQLEARLGQQVRDVVLAAGEKIVEAKDVVSRADQALAQMGAEKAGAPCHEDSLLGIVGTHLGVFSGLALCHQRPRRLRHIRHAVRP
jgi:hypothetical protein